MNNFQNIPDEIKAYPHTFNAVTFLMARTTYNPITGIVYYKYRNFGLNLTPRQKQWNARFGNSPAGSKNGEYIRVSFSDMNLSYYAHQIAFALMKWHIPLEVDHIDKNKGNNVWTNLRDAESHSNNVSNVFKRTNNVSGLKGVSWSKWSNRWRMDIGFNNIKYYSFHSTKEEAYQAYCKKSAELHKEFGCVE